jgi:alkylated DNA repair dioxygenase AlkB
MIFFFKEKYQMERIELSPSSWIDFKNLKDSSSLFSKNKFNYLWDNRCTTETYVTMFGKNVKVPRHQSSYGYDYEFSGQILKMEESIENSIYSDYLKLVNSIDPYYGFNQLVTNCYADGSKYIGAHSDDETQMEEYIVSTLTLCEPSGVRKFRIRDKRTKKIVQDFETKHGFYYVMGGNMQKEFTHEIVKIGGKKGTDTGRRISLTFRKFR